MCHHFDGAMRGPLGARLPLLVAYGAIPFGSHGHYSRKFTQSIDNDVTRNRHAVEYNGLITVQFRLGPPEVNLA